MIRNKLAIAAVALVGVLGAGLAQAREDVRFSVSIGAPAPVYTTGPAYVAGPAYGYDAPAYVPAPAYREERPAYGWYHVPARRVTPWDRDGDGIPNRYDRVYNPRWDVDGDGIPNRRDPHPFRYDGNRGWHR